MKSVLKPEKFYVIGNNLALDFVNSATHELTPENLLGWAIAVGLIDVSEAKDRAQKWKDSQFADVSFFRDRLKGTVVRLVESGRIPSEEVSWINEILRKKGGYSELIVTADGFSKKSKIDLSEPKEICVPIIESFVDLICYGQIEFVRKCERPDCILYFYDTTKNHMRRWCSMAICGNRAKVAKFYEKKKTKTSSGKPESK